MDLCLNITTEPAYKKKKKQENIHDADKSSVKKLEDKSVGNNKTDSVSQNVNKRIKQKSLSAIVARKLKETKDVDKNDVESGKKEFKLLSNDKNEKKEFKLPSNNQNNKSDISKSKSIHTSSMLNKQSLKPSKVSSEKNNSQDDSFISFTKVTQANSGKTLFVKKRDTTATESKKSLSDIFSKHNDKKETEFKIINSKSSNITDEKCISQDDIIINKFEFQEQKDVKNNDKISTTDSKKDVKKNDKVSTTDNKKKKHKKRSENSNNVKEGEDKPSNLFNKPGLKKTCLFHNNPDIPNIGQRLVKPVNEVVFTAKSFSDLDIHPFMVSNLEQNMQIKTMTMVQQKAIPQIFSGKDVLIRSQTGSGKTLAYALPIVELLHKIRPKLTRSSGLKALVIVPTRELALQTYECFLKLVKSFTWIVPGYLVGGEKRKAEKARLRKGCNILIATPGRLLDHIKHTSALRLADVKYFVLDEADRMLDMGYEKDISGIVDALKSSTTENNTAGYNPMAMLRQNVKKIFTDEETNLEEENSAVDEKASKKKIYNSDNESDSEKTSDESKIKVKKKTDSLSQNSVKEGDSADTNLLNRQTILLSATLTQAVEKLAGLTMQNPLLVDAAKENLVFAQGNMSEINEDLIVPQSVTQSYIVTPPKLRMVTLAAYITGKCQGSGNHRILVFMATQDMVDYYTDILSTVLTKPQDEDDDDSDPLVDIEFFKLHGSMSQKERTEVFKTFRQAKCSGVLLCTDVAARGLDMPKVDCVVQYTGPLSARDYVHRIGRTARAGSSGTTTIFLTPPEIEFVRLLESKRVRIKQEDMNDVLDKLLGPLSKHFSRNAAAIALQKEFETLVVENKTLREKACKAYVSWVRFYSSYPRDMREIFDRKQLHLGHYAKSFALSEAPRRVGGIGKALYEKEKSKTQHNNRLANEQPAQDDESKKKQSIKGGKGVTPGMLKRVRMLNTSEYDSGLEPIKKPKKS